MADQDQNDFAARLRRIETQRNAAEAVERLPATPFSRLALTLRLLSLVLAAVLGLKAVLVCYIGPAAYQQRVASLAQGDALDRLSARVMTPDPVTGLMAAAVADLTAPVATQGGNAIADIRSQSLGQKTVMIGEIVIAHRDPSLADRHPFSATDRHRGKATAFIAAPGSAGTQAVASVGGAIRFLAPQPAAAATLPETAPGAKGARRHRSATQP